MNCSKFIGIATFVYSNSGNYFITTRKSSFGGIRDKEVFKER